MVHVDATATTQLLARASRGDGSASEQLFPLVYDELRRLAAHYMAQQSAAHTLQATALVHEAWVKLIDVEAAQISDRAHFFRLAATAMRSILVDHARSKGRGKRGGDRQRVALDGGGDALEQAEGVAHHELVDLDESLERLEAVDEQLARIVELRFFAGLTAAESAEVLGVSARTVERGWRTARAWLGSDLGRPPS
jgi:RNA polymerase sigma factor (TIGR02999 family)